MSEYKPVTPGQMECGRKIANEKQIGRERFQQALNDGSFSRWLNTLNPKLRNKDNLLRVVLCFEQNERRATKTLAFPEGLSPAIGMVIQDSCDHDFKIREIMVQLLIKPLQVLVDVDYIPYEGGLEADLDAMATFGWEVSE